MKRGDTVPFRAWAKPGTRETLAEFFGEQGLDNGAEIGVFRGEYSRCLLHNNPNLNLICVDPWEAFSRRSNKRVMAQAYRRVVDMFGTDDRVAIKRMTSVEAVLEQPDNSLDFVYIDQMHDFDSIMLDLILWVPKVRSGGIVAGHDYCKQYQNGVISAMFAYTYAHGISRWYITRESLATWFWVK